MDLELSRIDACELCRGSVLDFYEILTGHDFQVDIRLPEGAVWVQGNKEALGRILSNLISNVIRYGADGKYLAVALRTGCLTACSPWRTPAPQHTGKRAGADYREKSGAADGRGPSRSSERLLPPVL